jgi:hypothetical protein
MPTKSDARKAARTTYKRKPTQAELPNGYTLDSRVSGKRAKVYVHKHNPGVINAHHGTQGIADKWTDLVAAVIVGRRRQSKRFQQPQAVTNRVRAAYLQAQITGVGHSLGGTLAQDTKGSDRQIPFNKATTLHDVLYKRRPKSQTDYRKTGDIISALSHVQPGASKVKRPGKWKDPFHAHKF